MGQADVKGFPTMLATENQVVPATWFPRCASNWPMRAL
jgi:hypothetical protein